MSDLFRKTSLSIMMEACKSEGCKKEGEAEVDSDFDELESEVEECAVVEHEIEYTAEYVPVIATEHCRMPLYLIEYDNLHKFMESAEIEDIELAMRDVAEANDINYRDCALMLESEEDIMDAIQEAKCSKKLSSKKKKATGGLNFFDVINKKKIKVVKKKKSCKRKK